MTRHITATIPSPRPAVDAADRWEIVTRAQAGDPDAFADLYRLYRPKVHALIWRRTNDRHLADDLTHDVFVRALRNVDGLSWQGRDPGAWFTTVARNIVVDHYKSGRYRIECTPGDDNAPENADTDRRGDPEQVAAFNATSRVLDAALAQLTAGERQVLALRFGAGLSVAETAAALGKADGAIKAAQYRACQKLARLLTVAGVAPC